jgi:hypothetical protein
MFRLRLLLALEVRRPVTDTPSILWQSRCRGGKIAINPSHLDFPSLLAEALDQLSVKDDDAKAAAESLKCSTTQFLNLLRDEPRALLVINARRAQRGLHSYR